MMTLNHHHAVRMNRVHTPLDRHQAPWHPCRTVLNTPPNSGNRSRQTSGFFTSVGFLWSGSAQLYKTRKGKTASGLLAVLKYPITPKQGDFSTNPIGTIMQTKSPTANSDARKESEGPHE